MRVDAALASFDDLFDDTEETSPTILPEDLAELEEALGLTHDTASPISSSAASAMMRDLDLSQGDARPAPVAASVGGGAVDTNKPVIIHRRSHGAGPAPQVQPVVRAHGNASDPSAALAFASALMAAAAVTLGLMSLWTWIGHAV